MIPGPRRLCKTNQRLKIRSRSCAICEPLRVGREPDPRLASPVSDRGSARARRGDSRRRRRADARGAGRRAAAGALSFRRGRRARRVRHRRRRARADREDASSSSAPVRGRRASAVGADEGAQALVDRGGASRRTFRRCTARTACRIARLVWDSTGRMSIGPAAKVEEELGEVRAQLRDHPIERTPQGAPVHDERHAALEAELGDLLFAVVNLCRKAGVHASLALDRANAKFTRRFASGRADRRGTRARRRRGVVSRSSTQSGMK